MKILASNAADELISPCPLDPLSLFSRGTRTRFLLRNWRLILFWTDSAQVWVAL